MRVETTHARTLPAGRFVLALGLLLPSIRAQEASGPPAAPGWTSISLVAHKGPMKATVDVAVRLVTAGEAGRDLVVPPDAGARNPSSDGLVVLDATTDAPFSAPQRSRTWMDPVHGVLQVESWQGKTHRRSRESVSGRHAWRWTRKGGSEVLVGERHRDGPPGGNALPVVDATSLLWLASASRLDREGSSMMAAAWSKEGLVAIRLVAMERAVLPLRAGVQGQGPAARRVEIAVADDRDDDDDEASSPSPFGLRGPVSLWLEEGTGLPLILEGRSAKIGRIRAVNVASGIR